MLALNDLLKPKRDFVQALRCRGCHNLRLHPNSGVLTCPCCGSLTFYTTIPREDEMTVAMKLYAKEVEELLCSHPHLLRE